MHTALENRSLGRCQVALALVLVALTRSLVASGSRHCCCCCSGTHGLHCTPASPTLTPHTLQMPAHHPHDARINANHGNPECNAGCMVASGALQVEAAHPVLGSVALPAVLRRPRAAPTHLRAAAIRLNVVIWTNMDPSEGGQKS